MKIKDPALYGKIKDFLTAYLPVLRAKSPNTVLAYRMTLNLYLSFMQECRCKALADITKDDFNQENILSFLGWLKTERQNCTATRNHRLVHLRQFCKYLMGLDMMSFAGYSQIQMISKEADPQKDELQYLTIDEMKTVLEQPDTKKNTGIRDRFFLALLYDSGCRDQEILDLCIKDFVLIKGNAQLHVIGKGRKYRATPISKDVQDMFVEYCRVFHPIIKNEDFLFYTVRNGIRTRMSPDNVARFMNKYEKQIKEKQPEFPHLHPHLFRHTRAMHLYLAGMPLPLVSEWLGHSQLETTTIYARATTEMKRKALERISTEENTVFKKDETFKYADNDEVLKRLYGLA